MGGTVAAALSFFGFVDKHQCFKSVSRCRELVEEHKNGVMLEHLGRLKTSHAVSFWISCRGQLACLGRQVAIV